MVEVDQPIADYMPGDSFRAAFLHPFQDHVHALAFVKGQVSGRGAGRTGCIHRLRISFLCVSYNH